MAEENAKWEDLLVDAELTEEEEEVGGEGEKETAADGEEPSAVQEGVKEELPEEKAEGSVQETPPAPKPMLTPEQVRELRANFESELAKRFTFTEEESAALQVEPDKVLPKMAARLYADILEDVGRMINSSVPGLLQEYSVAMQRELKAQQEFYSVWPELRGYDDQVLMVGRMFREMHPDATPKEAIQRIGEIASAMLGVKRQQQQQPAFKPAGAGKIPAPPPQPNKWEQIFSDE